MNKEDTEKAIALMQAFVDGKTIECRFRRGPNTRPFVFCPSPSWDFLSMEYRAKAPVPDSIDWSHVAGEYKFMARDSNGTTWLYTEVPSHNRVRWFPTNARCIPAKHFSSYKQGDLPWDESLVVRPETKIYHPKLLNPDEYD